MSSEVFLQKSQNLNKKSKTFDYGTSSKKITIIILFDVVPITRLCWNFAYKITVTDRSYDGQRNSTMVKVAWQFLLLSAHGSKY